MKAGLVFIGDNGTRELVKYDELEELDKFTFNFLDSEVLKESFCFVDGDFKIMYMPSELPLTSLYLYPDDIYKEAFLDPLYGSGNIKPEMCSFIQNINYCLKEINKIQFLNNLLEEQLTEEEKLIHCVGTVTKNNEQLNRGNLRYIKETASGVEGYFFMRYVNDKLMNGVNTTRKTIIR